MLVFGIASGLAAATFQSVSYLATRHFVQRRGEGASRDLLIMSHVLMGAVSLVLLPLLWPAEGINWSRTIYPLVMTALFYLLGQMGLMMALKHAEASRISPLLGLKVVVLALLATAFTLPQARGGLSMLQWGAVVLCVVAAFLLTNTGGRLKGKAIAATMFACVAYAASDWHIALLSQVIVETTSQKALAPVLGAALCYSLCGVGGLAFLPMLRVRKAAAWRDAAPYSAAWLAAMFALFTCFALVGPVLGNILQSTRGLISIGMGSMIAARGHHHIEARTTRDVFIRRLLAGTLMFAAIVLYVLGRNR